MRPVLILARQAGIWFTYAGGMKGWVDLGVGDLGVSPVAKISFTWIFCVFTAQQTVQKVYNELSDCACPQSYASVVDNAIQRNIRLL